MIVRLVLHASDPCHRWLAIGVSQQT